MKMLSLSSKVVEELRLLRAYPRGSRKAAEPQGRKSIAGPRRDLQVLEFSGSIEKLIPRGSALCYEHFHEAILAKAHQLREKPEIRNISK